ncbi:MAG: hypothetical protein DSY98_06055 [SAR324 cluster bacterium]|uniref:Uncharacterized protein n=1 Tax=SAR324 cluster bacterium TaxID=2024889 RepID=A0A432G721_9DELT|nr:MAG: hypothetical protein DSY98_06055 [SAR324 cluster bacterium]
MFSRIFLCVFNMFAKKPQSLFCCFKVNLTLCVCKTLEDPDRTLSTGNIRNDRNQFFSLIIETQNDCIFDSWDSL